VADPRSVRPENGVAIQAEVPRHIQRAPHVHEEVRLRHQIPNPRAETQRDGTPGAADHGVVARPRYSMIAALIHPVGVIKPVAGTADPVDGRQQSML
jgi:hypothetical protein